MKSKKSKKTSLKRVEARAIADREFWTRLRKAPAQTLRESGMALDAADAKRLKGILAMDGKTFRVDLDRLMRARADMSTELTPGGIPGVSWIGIWARPGRPKSPKGKP